MQERADEGAARAAVRGRTGRDGGRSSRDAGRPGRGLGRALLLGALAALLVHGAAEGQRLEEYDYANLRLRGAGAELFVVSPSDHDATVGFGGRLDLGFLGPNVRVMPRVAYWSSELKSSEVQRLEERLEALAERDTPGDVTINLGAIDRSAFIVGTDFHWLPIVQGTVRPYLGVGAEVYLLNGSGEAIEDTFVEDGLDLITAGASAVGGLEYELSEGFALYGDLRGTLVADVGSLTFTVGVAYIVP